MALNTVSSDRLSTNVKNTNFTAAEKQDLTNDILPLATQFGQSKNLIINGAMNVAQRGTSSTTFGYHTVDRFQTDGGGHDEIPTQAQVDVSSSDTPYTLGLTKAWKITNGNQTSGAGAADYMRLNHKIEAQVIRNSGWNYKSSSSNITLSFWVKSSVAQTFYLTVKAEDSPSYLYATPYSATTSWTKITKTIPGNSNLVFNNDSGVGLTLFFTLFYGTDYTDNSVSDDTWGAYNGSNQTKDQTSTWYTTNDATFELTGVQLEVSSVATDFEHRSFGQELALCQRYLYKTYDYATVPGTATFVGAQHGRNFDPGAARSSVPICLNFPVRMRAVPTLTWYAGDGQSNRYSTGSTVGGSDLTTENSVGTSIDESETGIYHANFSEDVPATNLYAYHVVAAAEL